MFLVSSDKTFPISVAEIKLELGLSGNEVDSVIEAGIAAICLMTPGTRRETWFVARDEDAPVSAFLTKAARYGRVESIGEGYHAVVNMATGMKRFGHDVTLMPKPEAIRSAKAKILKWCMEQDDIWSSMNRREPVPLAIAAE